MADKLRVRQDASDVAHVSDPTKGRDAAGSHDAEEVDRTEPSPKDPVSSLHASVEEGAEVADREAVGEDLDEIDSGDRAMQASDLEAVWIHAAPSETFADDCDAEGAPSVSNEQQSLDEDTVHQQQDSLRSEQALLGEAIKPNTIAPALVDSPVSQEINAVRDGKGSPVEAQDAKDCLNESETPTNGTVSDQLDDHVEPCATAESVSPEITIPLLAGGAAACTIEPDGLDMPETVNTELQTSSQEDKDFLLEQISHGTRAQVDSPGVAVEAITTQPAASDLFPASRVELDPVNSGIDEEDKDQDLIHEALACQPMQKESVSSEEEISPVKADTVEVVSRSPINSTTEAVLNEPKPDDKEQGQSEGDTISLPRATAHDKETTPTKSPAEQPQSPSLSLAPSTPGSISVKVNLNDDESVLHAFLSRAKASKAARIANRSSVSYKRDSDAVKTALASPKPMGASSEDFESNSPTAAECPEPTANDRVPSSPNMVMGGSLAMYIDRALGIDSSLEPAQPAPRRSKRGASPKFLDASLPNQAQTPLLQTAPQTITVRRTGSVNHIMVQKQAAQQLSSSTRINTNKNKSGALSVRSVLLRLQEEEKGSEASPIDGDKAVVKPASGKRNVRWNEELVSFFNEPDGAGIVSEDFALEDITAATSNLGLAQPASATASQDPSPLSETPSASTSVSKPRAKRAKALGAMNGTPAKPKVKQAMGDAAPAAPTGSMSNDELMSFITSGIRRSDPTAQPPQLQPPATRTRAKRDASPAKTKERAPSENTASVSTMAEEDASESTNEHPQPTPAKRRRQLLPPPALAPAPVQVLTKAADNEAAAPKSGSSTTTTTRRSGLPRRGGGQGAR